MTAVGLTTVATPDISLPAVVVSFATVITVVVTACNAVAAYTKQADNAGEGTAASLAAVTLLVTFARVIASYDRWRIRTVYHRCYGVAICDGLLVSYVGNVYNLVHINSPPRQILPLRKLPPQDRAVQSPIADCTQETSRRSLLRCLSKMSSRQEWGR